MHDLVSIPVIQDESSISRHSKLSDYVGYTNFIEFSSVNERSALEGFSGERTKIVFNSSVWRYGKFIA